MTAPAKKDFYTFRREALPDPSRFPEADAVVLDEEVEIVLHPDGRTEKTLRRAWVLLTDFGRDNYCDVPMAFRQGRQEVAIHEACAYLRDGKKTESPSYARNQVTPFPVDRAPDLADLQQLMISIVGSETGGPLALQATLSDVEPWKEFFWGEEPLGGPFPILRKMVTVKVPKGHALAHAVRNGDAKPETSTEGDYDVYVWKAFERPAFDAEDRQPGSDRWVPTVVYSAKGGWPEVTAALAQRVAKSADPGPSFKALVEEKGKDTTDDVEKALKLHKFVKEGIRSIDVNPADFDYALRPASRVFESAYGTPFEKALVLAALAREAGLGARLALVTGIYHTTGPVAYPGPAPEPWVEITAGGRALWFHPNRSPAEANGLHLEDSAVIPVSSPAKKPETPKISRPAGVSEVEADLVLKEDLTLEGKVAWKLHGFLNPYTRFVLDEKTTVDGFAGECAAKLFGGKAENVRAEMLCPDRAAFRFELKGAKAQRLGVPFVALEWPNLPEALHGFTAPYHRETRATSLPLPGSAQFSLTWKVKLPKDARVRIPAPAWKRQGPAATIQAAVEEKDGTITVTATWNFTKKWIHPEEYPKFRRALADAANPESRAVLLEGF